MKKTIALIEKSAELLDKIADSHGTNRALNIALLAQNLLELAGGIGEMMKEIQELRKFKEEHSDNDNSGNEVPAES